MVENLFDHSFDSFDETADSKLFQLLRECARGSTADFNSVLHGIEATRKIADTKVIVSTHCIAMDGNRRVRVKDFAKTLAQHVIEYAIPRSQIANAYEHAGRTKSLSRIVSLHNDAKKLFTSLSNSGEAGELLLYVFGEVFLKAPQLICKMNLKTSSAMHFHGADGLHVGSESGNLILYWGESKLHANPTNAIRECLESISPLLNSEGGIDAANNRDIQLLQRGVDFNNPEIDAALKSFLDPSHENFRKTEFRGICLVGFDDEAYPSTPNEKELTKVISEIALKIPKWDGQVRKRVSIERLESFNIHFFYLPFPSIENFRKAFRIEVGLEEHAGGGV